MNRTLSCLGGMGLGAGLMYFFDADVGRRRRALVRDQLVHAGRQLGDFLDMACRDLGHRLQGIAAEATAMCACDEASDEVVAARVRSKIGRYVSHPKSIEVTVHDGRVTVAGPVLEREVPRFISAILAVRGVTRVDNHLDVHRESGTISGLQGGRPPTGEPLEWSQANWSPAMRLVAGLGGGLLLGCAASQRFPTACILGMLGLASLTRAVTNQSLFEVQPSRGTARERQPASSTAETKPNDRPAERAAQEAWGS